MLPTKKLKKKKKRKIIPIPKVKDPFDKTELAIPNLKATGYSLSLEMLKYLPDSGRLIKREKENEND